MSTIVTNDLSPGAGNIGLILDHNIYDFPLFGGDTNSQAVISVNADGLYEFFTFQALLFLGVRSLKLAFCVRVPDLVFDPFYVPAAQALDLAAEFEVALDLFVIEDAEAVDDRDGAAGHPDDLRGVELHVGLGSPMGSGLAF